MRSTVDDVLLLELWEHAVAVPAPLRGEALLAAVGRTDVAALGDRNRNLIALHHEMFGTVLEWISQCPQCGETARFDANLEALIQPATDHPDEAHRFAWGTYTIDFRRIEAGDVDRAAEGASSDDAFARRLLERCVVSCRAASGDPVALEALPIEALDALSSRMEDIDPAASIAFDVGCPDCGTHWSAPLDVPHMLWRRLQSAAEALLIEIDALARAYGWREHEILALTPLRRAAYLQMVNG